MFVTLALQLSGIQALLPPGVRIESNTGWVKTTWLVTSNSKTRSLGIYVHDTIVSEREAASPYLLVLFEKDPEQLIWHREQTNLPAAVSDIVVTKTDDRLEVAVARDEIDYLYISFNSLSSSKEALSVPYLEGSWTSKTGHETEKPLKVSQRPCKVQRVFSTKDVNMKWPSASQEKSVGASPVAAFARRMSQYATGQVFDAGVFTWE